MQTIILIGLFLCHTLADYTHLSTEKMLAAKRFGKPLAPIILHALMHTMLMFFFLLFITDSWILIPVLAIQFISHFLIDTWKGRMNGWFPSLQNPANKWHWVIFGTDQYLHALIIIAMSAMLIRFL